MIGKIFVTSSGYDPQMGKHVKDPYLGENPTLGACRPDIREKLDKGDQIFVVSGKVRGEDQFVMGGFEIEEKITAIEAYERFPHLRLHKLDDGQVAGNIIVNAFGEQHELDHHKQFQRRIENYVVGTNPIVLATEAEMTEARLRTLEILQEVFQIKGKTIREVMGRCRNLSEKQIKRLRALLADLKRATSHLQTSDVSTTNGLFFPAG